MEAVRIITFTLLFFFINSCNEDPVEFNDDNEIKFILSYEKKEDNTIYNVVFKGNLHGPIDSIKMKIPELFLFGVESKTFIRYTIPDTFAYAKREYKIEKELHPGSYDIYMMLQCLDNIDIFSDTMHIDFP